MSLQSLSEVKRKILERVFFDVEKSPVAYLPATTVYNYIRSLYGGDFIRKRDVDLFERTFVRPSQILRESRSDHKKTIPYFVHGRNLLWQADLVDLHKPKGQKGRHAFVLTVIDVFSRKADAELVYDKSGTKVTNAFRKIGERWGEFPVRLQTDKGKEFFNRIFTQFLKSKNVTHFYVSSKFKAAVVESFNRRFQKLFYLYKQGNPHSASKKLVKWVIHNYNRLPHRYHGFRPIDIEGDLADQVLRVKVAERRGEISKKAEKNKKPFKFKIGQTVRTTRLKKTFFKGYRGVFTEEIFVVSDRFRRKPHVDVNLYRLQDLRRRPIVNSIYYEKELLKVELPENPPIKKVLRRSKKGDKKEVTFKDFPADFSLWM